MVQPDMEIANRIFAQLDKHWQVRDGNQGIYRPCYDRAEEEAIDIFVSEAEKIGLKVSRDLVGNVYLFLEGSDESKSVIISGSHVDSVPFGGRYDGTAGVVSALSAIGGLVNAGIKLFHGLCVMICRGEESAWFGQVSIGSKFAVGELKADILTKKNTHLFDISLHDAMKNIGLNPEKLNGQNLLPFNNIACFVELHIEQGPMLERQGIPAGIVTGIRGNIRYAKIECFGEAGHTGTVPHEMRKDAVRASVRLLAELEDEFINLQKSGNDLVFTFPIAKTSDVASHTTIPNYFSFALEVRSEDIKILSHCREIVENKLDEVAKRYNVEFSTSEPTVSKPAKMDIKIQNFLEKCANTLGVKNMKLPSGAGHDAAVFANYGIPTGMIFVRHDGISHRHDETMDWNDFTLGTKILMKFFKEWKSK